MDGLPEGLKYTVIFSVFLRINTLTNLNVHKHTNYLSLNSVLARNKLPTYILLRISDNANYRILNLIDYTYASIGTDIDPLPTEFFYICYRKVHFYF